MDRHSILVAMALVAPIGAVAQVADHDTVAAERGLIEEVAGIKKKTDKFNLYLNMRGDFNAAWRGSTFDEGGVPYEATPHRDDRTDQRLVELSLSPAS